jgi:hypothetical protein
MAGLPLVLLSALALFPPPTNDELGSFSEMSQVYAAIYGGLILRTLIFFGCAWVFMNLFRGEVVDRSLHYYFLAPVRREVLVVGKYLSGLIATIVLFSITTVGSMFIYYFWLFPSESARFFFDGAGAGQMLAYLGVTILACLGYGAVFLLVGLFFRNPIIPAVALRLGVDQLSAAAVLEEDKRDSLPAHRSCPCRCPKVRSRCSSNRRPRGFPCRVFFYLRASCFFSRACTSAAWRSAMQATNRKDMRTDEFLPLTMRSIRHVRKCAARDILTFIIFRISLAASLLVRLCAVFFAGRRQTERVCFLGVKRLARNYRRKNPRARSTTRMSEKCRKRTERASRSVGALTKMSRRSSPSSRNRWKASARQSSLTSKPVSSRARATPRYLAGQIRTKWEAANRLGAAKVGNCGN